ncbi:hypothetical protein ACA910_001472 [Epithemia clementina (nom. ined.)]
MSQFLQPESLAAGERVYIRDEHHVWLPALVLECQPDRVLVQIDLPSNWHETTLAADHGAKTTTQQSSSFKHPNVEGSCRWIELNDYKDRQLPMQNETDAPDMADLRYLNEAAVLYQVKNRHLARKPYTRVGEIVIAMNPCKWINELYSSETQHLYAKNFVWNADKAIIKEDDREEKKSNLVVTKVSSDSSSVYGRLGFEPHVYEVSAMAYRGMFLEQKNQTILVSGESGAGKTETVKIVLEHLATLDSSALLQLPNDSEQSVIKSNDLVHKIIASSPIFEAFGNAHTMRNHNSSRFGKMTRLHFAALDNGMWGLRGSTCQTYLLESNRVVSQAVEERNFHIFYQLLAAPEELKEELLGMEWREATANDFRYLNKTETTEGERSDRNDWFKTFSALKLFNWKDNTLAMLAKVLAAILRLGNIVFLPNGDDNGCTASTYDLLLAAQLLEVEPDVLEHAMTRRLVETARDCFEVPLAPEAAKDSLDALVKKIYAFMFSWVVSSVNEETQGFDGDGIISLLDIYGFECFDTNQFEQLCINYANEKLHKKYLDDNFARFKIEYESEGIEIFDFAKIDNDPVLQLFDGPSGLIGSISEECRRPQGNSTNFVRRIKQMHSGNDRLVNDKLGGECQFGVVHFAGPVVYDADLFVERNTDSLPSILALTMSKAKNEIIRGAFLESDDDSSARKGSSKKTILDKFRVELKELIASIDQTQSRYIRCIKPNESLSATLIDQATVMRQLKCAGLVAAIDLSRESFPSKLPFINAEERFRCLLDEANQKMLIDLPLHDRVQFMMSILFAPVLQVYSNCDYTLPFACGKTRVYFRAGALELLESKRQEYYSARTVILQTWIRGFRAKQSYTRFRRTLIIVQSCARSRLQRSKFLRLVAGVRLIQANHRAREGRYNYLKTKFVIVQLQATVRANQGKMLFHKFKEAAILISASSRMFCKQQRFRRSKMYAMRIQCVWRGYIDRREHEKRALAALTIQTAIRDFLDRQRQKHFSASSRIQSAWREHQNNREAKKKAAAMTIQSGWRMYKKKTALAATIVQNGWRKYQKAEQKRHMATLDIQSAWRSYRRKQKLPVAAIKSVGRLDKQDKTKLHAVFAIQSAWRTYRNPQSLRHKAALIIQSTWHRKRNIEREKQLNALQKSAWRMFDNRGRKNAAVKIQSTWRKHSVRNVATKQTQPLLQIPETPKRVEKLDMSDTQSWMSSPGESTPRESHRGQESLLSNLHKEIGARDVAIHQLRDDVAAIAADAETRKQELEAEYEERLLAYEEEVLHLRELLGQYEQEKAGFAEKEKATKEYYEKNMCKLKILLEKTQASHKDYLLNITSVLDKATEARRIETEKILDEVDRIKKAKNAEIHSLTRQLDAMKDILRKRNEISLTMSDSMQRQRLLALLSPQSILNAVEVVKNRSQTTKEKHVEDAITKPAEKIIDGLFDLASHLDLRGQSPTLR